eukprot:CAMPEP_0206425442 /NCGR_PEP_ID=MMETSP0324_2-20121206/3794_1 /ASSEMBLY_ACC=CAM_ASM_000836 /TAXON_ID=2866 /ORGANISM="Crypthecodinium cohnii, Strain Seligo" /LENGTH=466 /DNA_ID=CAMNT_0053890225 /DNA_START=12 /DNA_END=1412 /DNA_ORIENTATION=+
MTSGSMQMGSAPERINIFAWTALAFFCMLGPFAYLAEKMWVSAGKNRTRTHLPYWSIVLLFFSYALLIPGLVCTLFQFKIAALGGDMELKKGDESMIRFMHLLGSTGCWYGALIVAVYAILIPAMKLTLLIVAEVLRIRSPSSVRIARWCILVVQTISKWASPDMFAYVLLIRLVRGLDHPPTVLGDGHLDAGFTCFALFCIFSTMASLGIKAPPLPQDTGARSPTVGSEWQSTSSHDRRRQIIPYVAAVLLGGFIAALVIGSDMPCMALSLNVDLLFEPVGTLPLVLKPFIESLHLEKLVHTEVTLWDCTKTMAQWGSNGDANFFIAFLMFAVFTMLITVLDMIVLFIASVQLHLERQGRTTCSCRVINFSRTLKKMAMLDVAIVGVVVVVLCGYVYRSVGVILSMRPGLAVLAAAEVCHYATYHLVTGCSEPQATDTGKALEETTGESEMSPQSSESTATNDIV